MLYRATTEVLQDWCQHKLEGMHWTLLSDGDTGAQQTLLDPSRPEGRYTSPQSSRLLFIGLTMAS